MLNKIIDFLQKFANNEQSELDRFILSKNPTNTAELEYWIEQYTYRQQGWKL